MKLRLYLLLTGVLFFSVVQAQRKRAFLVGISHYDTALTGYQWNNINGVEDVHLLTPILKKQGFSTVALLDEKATFDGIIRQLNLFTNSIKKGDLVYLHFSAHGQPVEDLNGDETDGWDEAIVPIDAYKLYKKGVYEGQRHLLDDQLNSFVRRMREKIGPTGFLYVVIDACHAGTASRANDEMVRGTNVGFSSTNKVFKPVKNSKPHYQIEKNSNISHVLFLEACRQDQVNREIQVGDKHFGTLSYHIAQTLSHYLLNANAVAFLESVKKTQMSFGRWPNNQNLVVEKSF